MGVVAEPCGSGPIGIAYPRTKSPDPRGSVALFKVVVGKHEPPGFWECQRREFVPTAEDRAGG